MTIRESSFRETSYPGKWLSGKRLSGKRLSGKKTIRESNHPGNDCKPQEPSSTILSTVSLADRPRWCPGVGVYIRLYSQSVSQVPSVSYTRLRRSTLRFTRRWPIRRKTSCSGSWQASMMMSFSVWLNSLLTPGINDHHHRDPDVCSSSSLLACTPSPLTSTVVIWVQL